MFQAQLIHLQAAISILVVPMFKKFARNRIRILKILGMVIT
jgi:hypothetical protein